MCARSSTPSSWRYAMAGMPAVGASERRRGGGREVIHRPCRCLSLSLLDLLDLLELLDLLTPFLPAGAAGTPKTTHRRLRPENSRAKARLRPANIGNKACLPRADPMQQEPSQLGGGVPALRPARISPPPRAWAAPGACLAVLQQNGSGLAS
ncbi:hypothetical protein ABPG77_010521 [Micractinium sp. CCAP 211/92]